MFKSLLDMCKVPERKRALRLLKVCLIHFKANNNMSKYSLEVMRFLVQQQCTLAARGAHAQFYGMFVNTHGRIDSHIPCDLQMENIAQFTVTTDHCCTVYVPRRRSTSEKFAANTPQ
jgi:hypothetical protein